MAVINKRQPRSTQQNGWPCSAVLYTDRTSDVLSENGMFQYFLDRERGNIV